MNARVICAALIAMNLLALAAIGYFAGPKPRSLPPSPSNKQILEPVKVRPVERKEIPRLA